MNEYDYSDSPRRSVLPAGNRELIFGLLAVLLGLFLGNMILFGGFRLGFAVGAVLSVCLSWGYLRCSGCRGDWYTAALLGLSLVIAAGFGWSDDAFVKFWLLLFLVTGVNLSLCLMAKKNRRSPGSARSLYDAGMTIFRFGFGQAEAACRGVG